MKHDDETGRIEEKDEAFVRDVLRKRPAPKPFEGTRRIVMRAACEQAAKRAGQGRNKTALTPAKPVRLKRFLQWGLAAAAVFVFAIFLRWEPEIRSPEQAEKPPTVQSVVMANGTPRLAELDDRIDSVRTRMKNLRAAPSSRDSYGKQETAKLLKRTLRLKARVDEMNS